MPLHIAAPQIFNQQAINALTAAVWNDDNNIYIPIDLEEETVTAAMPNTEHFCAPVVHPKTGEVITKYAKLAQDPDPEIRTTWRNGIGKEFGNMAQGDNRTGTPGMDVIFVLDHEQIKAIPKHKTITYARLVVDFRPQKKGPQLGQNDGGRQLDPLCRGDHHPHGRPDNS